MADITKCTNEACPLKSACYRWTVRPDPLWQSYTRFEPYHNGDYYGCNHHIPVHRNNPFTDREQEPNAIPSNSRELG